jgi:transposase
MEQYVGLDVSQEQTSVCVVDSGGKVIWEGKCTSSPEAITATLRTRAPEVVRIGLESGPLSAWHGRELRKLGLPVVCLDARHAKAALAVNRHGIRVLPPFRCRGPLSGACSSLQMVITRREEHGCEAGRIWRGRTPAASAVSAG